MGSLILTNWTRTFSVTLFCLFFSDHCSDWWIKLWTVYNYAYRTSLCGWGKNLSQT